jgi:hypothetical protein
MFAGDSELPVNEPELRTSVVLTLMSLMYLLWTLFAFPGCLHPLPQSVRFPNRRKLSNGGKNWRRLDESKMRSALIIAGTLRIFVQSAILLAVALIMRDVGVTGGFRQTFVVATLVLLPVPFEACAARSASPKANSNAVVIHAIGVVLVTVCVLPKTFAATSTKASFYVLELAVLILVNATVAPLHVARIGHMSLPEQTMVYLEWSKSYVGRLGGPVFALVVYNWLGSGALVILLCAATVYVARHA